MTISLSNISHISTMYATYIACSICKCSHSWCGSDLYLQMRHHWPKIATEDLQIWHMQRLLTESVWKLLITPMLQQSFLYCLVRRVSTLAWRRPSRICVSLPCSAARLLFWDQDRRCPSFRGWRNDEDVLQGPILVPHLQQPKTLRLICFTRWESSCCCMIYYIPTSAHSSH